eukprot:Amastigsp_a677837_1002.p3 type:complete len:171 gc:universal Amastigsp_a677837_1002:44-556(+)
MTPVPTVLLDSRIVNRMPGSMAIGLRSSTPTVTLSPGVAISTPFRSSMRPVTSAARKKRLGEYFETIGVWRPPSAFVRMYTSASNLEYCLMVPGAQITIPRRTSSRLMPRRRSPQLSPAMADGRLLRNISMPVTTVRLDSPKPMMSTSAPLSRVPASTRPVVTVPRPETE